jgi:hypothetical protein
MPLTLFIESDALLDALTLAKQHSPYLELLILGMIAVIWRDRNSDARLTERMRTLEEEINNALLSFTKEEVG